MAPTFSSPLIQSILSDYRYEAVVPEDQYEVMFDDRSFSIRVQDHTDLYFRPVNPNCYLGLIFILEDFYRCDMLAKLTMTLMTLRSTRTTTLSLFALTFLNWMRKSMLPRTTIASSS
jgi:hypothetical protein